MYVQTENVSDSEVIPKKKVENEANDYDPKINSILLIDQDAVPFYGPALGQYIFIPHSHQGSMKRPLEASTDWLHHSHWAKL